MQLPTLKLYIPSIGCNIFANHFKSCQVIILCASLGWYKGFYPLQSYDNDVGYFFLTPKPSLYKLNKGKKPWDLPLATN